MPPAEGPRLAPRPGRRRLAGPVRALGPLVLLVVLVGGARFAVEPMQVSSGSMSPTYVEGDEVLVLRSPLAAAPGRGDVVVLREPRSSTLVIKRVVAVGGDRIRVRDGHLLVNGTRPVEAFVDHARVDGSYFGPVLVPAGSVFVLGDNRADSVDSRDFGVVAENRVEGSVVLRLWGH